MSKPAVQIDNVMDNIPYYDKWQMGEGIPIVKTFFVQDLKKVELKPWDRTGGSGAFINMEGAEGATGAYVLEIAPGKHTNPQKHLYEDLIFVLKGRGATTICNDKGAKQTFEWQDGSLFALPLNCTHQHFNGSGSEPARFFSVNSMPIVFNLFHSADFIFNTPRDFSDRFDGDPEYFSGKGKAYPGRVWDTNFIADARNFALEDWKERGAAGKNVMLEMANGSMAAHISEFPVGTYKKAHRHGPGFNVIVIKGQGFSLFWREGEEPKRYDWQDGSVFTPPAMMFHQHFNIGATGARYLPPRLGGIKYSLGEGFGDITKVDKDVKQGGNQIEYYDEAPWIRKMFEEELAKSGTTTEMNPDFYKRPAN
jgi:oxalate decarboxylase/phosphoglucose isomerase-like protein (cupin superfamily)